MSQALDTADASTSTRRGIIGPLIRNPLALGSAIALVLLVLLSLAAPLLAVNPPGISRLDMVNAPPGPDYLLGGDGAGRDVFSRLLHGGRITLLGAAIAGFTAAALGVSTGLAAGFRGRTLDTVTSWISDVVMVLPSIIVLVALFTVIGPNALLTMAVLGVMLAPSFFRLTRNLVISVRRNLYIDAARVSGLSDQRIVARHVLRVIRAPLIIHLALVMGIAIGIQAGLDFIGLGDSSVPTWGGMLQESFRNMYRAPTQFIWPGLAIGIAVGAFVLLGNGLRDALEDWGKPTSRRRIRASLTPKAPRSAATTESQAETSSPVPRREGVIVVHDLAVGYSDREGAIRRVVERVSFAVQEGEIVGLVGESGSGKTQTALSILRLLPTGGSVVQGSIFYRGVDVAGLSESEMDRVRGAEIAYVPQEPMSNLDPSERIGTQLTEPLRVRGGLTRREAKAKALDLLRQVNIVDPERVFRSYPHEISGGMAQRVLIAGAVSCDPAVLIADEPTTALDVTVQAEVLSILRSLRRDRKLTVILVTHNFGVVADLCDRVVVMRHGHVVEEASVDEIFTSPQHEYTRMLLDSTLDGRPSRLERDADAREGVRV